MFICLSRKKEKTCQNKETNLLLIPQVISALLSTQSVSFPAGKVKTRTI